MPNFDKTLRRIEKIFDSAFGTTQLDQRIQDLHAQVIAVSRYRDLNHLKMETGDLLCSVLQLCNESGWQPSELIDQTLEKIEQRSDLYQTLGRKLKVGLMMDAFDPIQNDHLRLAQAAIDAGEIDEVWLMPAFATIGGPSMAPANERVKMCELAMDGIRGLKTFDYEIKHQFRGDDYYLVKKLLGEPAFQNRIDFFFIVGQDAANDWMSLPNGQQLERLLPVVVIPRQGQTPDAHAWYLKPPHLLADVSPIEAAAGPTEIRDMLQRTNSRADDLLADLLPPRVLKHIREHAIYAPGPPSAATERIALYSDSFNPPTLAHRDHIKALLAQGFTQVIVHPAGLNPQHDDRDYSSPRHRAALVSLAFNDMPRVLIDYDDISLGTHRSLRELQLRYEGAGEVWLVVERRSVELAPEQTAPLITQFNGDQRLWQSGRFLVLDHTHTAPEPTRLPPTHRMISVPASPACRELRSMVFHSQPIEHWVHRDVADYILRHRLYIPGSHQAATILQLDDPRLLVVFDERNAKAVAIAQKYLHLQSPNPNLILVIGGDGTMLRAIREQWRRRLPFVGLNSGHLGFLMNERLPEDLKGVQLLSQILPLLRVDSKSLDDQPAMHLAYGDAWLERAEGQAAWIRVDINGETMLDKVVGDGMLVSTASGSSAYARAMGAVPVPIDSPVLTLAGSNIFQPRFWRPMNLPLSSRITLTNLDTINKRPLRAFVDGNPLGLVKEISVRASQTAGVEVAFTREFEPANKLLRSLFPREQD